MVFSPDRQVFAFLRVDGCIGIYDFRIAFSLDGTRLAAASLKQLYIISGCQQQVIWITDDRAATIIIFCSTTQRPAITKAHKILLTDILHGGGSAPMPISVAGALTASFCICFFTRQMALFGHGLWGAFCAARGHCSAGVARWCFTSAV
jgi:hypothetical protein